MGKADGELPSGSPALSSRPAMRLGVLGGTFDPVHLAHLLTAEAVREALRLDLVLFVPAGLQPFKPQHSVTPADDRLAMLEIALADNPYFAVSLVDVNRTGLSYTVNTVRQLHEEWGDPELQMWFILGADALASFPDWHDPEGVLAQTRLAAVRRPGTAVEMEALSRRLPALKDAVDWVDAPLVEISATDIRQRVREGLSIRYRVTEGVREYIEAHGLYK